MMRWKAKNPPGTREYYFEPYTVQHVTDWVKQCVRDARHFIILMVSKKKRVEMARVYNSAIFGGIPTEQIIVFDKDGHRPLRPEERMWPE